MTHSTAWRLVSRGWHYRGCSRAGLLLLACRPITSNHRAATRGPARSELQTTTTRARHYLNLLQKGKVTCQRAERVESPFHNKVSRQNINNKPHTASSMGEARRGQGEGRRSADLGKTRRIGNLPPRRCPARCSRCARRTHSLARATPAGRLGRIRRETRS